MSIGTNNPLNIRYNKANKWRGQIGYRKGFINFTSVEYCFRTACYLIMQSYRKRGIYTYEAIVKTWAPSHENPTDIYISFVCGRCGVTSIDVPSCKLDVAKLVVALYQFETGESHTDLFSARYSPSYVLNIIDMFNLKFYYK